MLLGEAYSPANLPGKGLLGMGFPRPAFLQLFSSCYRSAFDAVLMHLVHPTPRQQAASTGQQVSGFQLTIPDAEDPQHFVLHGEQGELQAGGPGVASHQLERAMAASSVRGLHALLEPSLVKHHLRCVAQACMCKGSGPGLCTCLSSSWLEQAQLCTAR